MVELFFRCASYGSSCGQAGIILNGFQLLVKRHTLEILYSHRYTGNDASTLSLKKNNKTKQNKKRIKFSLIIVSFSFNYFFQEAAVSVCYHSLWNSIGVTNIARKMKCPIKDFSGLPQFYFFLLFSSYFYLNHLFSKKI